MPSQSSSSRVGKEPSVPAKGVGATKVVGNMKFLRDTLDSVAEYLIKDGEILGDMKNERAALLNVAANVVSVEHANSVMQRHIDQAVQQSHRQRQERSVVEQERRRLASINEGSIRADENARSSTDRNNLDSGNTENRKRSLESDVNERTKKMIADINAATKRDLHAFDPKNQAFINDLRERLQQEEEGDNEVTVQRTGPSDRDFNCPYSSLRMTKPMSNTNMAFKCNHRIDFASIEVMFRKKREVDCPVSGCVGKWVSHMVEEDSSFLKKMERHFALKEHSQSANSARAATQRDVQDVDLAEERYTAV